MALWPTPLAFFSGTKRELSRSSSCSSNSMLQVLASDIYASISCKVE